MEFKRIALKGTEERVHLIWLQNKTEDAHELHEVLFVDPPLESFKKRLRALIPHVIDMLDLPDKYGEHIKVRGAILKADDEGVLSVQIMARRDLKNGRTWNFLTPLLVDGNPASGKAGLLPEGCSAVIQKLISEAEKYLRGDRLQVELPMKSEDTVGAED